MIVRFVDIGEVADHHCLEVIVCFVDIRKVKQADVYGYVYV